MYPVGDSGFSLEKFPVLSSWTLPYRPFKDWTALALTVTTRRQHPPPPVGALRLSQARLSNLADSIISHLAGQLFAVHTKSLGSVRVTEEAGN